MRITCLDWAALVAIGGALLVCIQALWVWAVLRAVRETARHYHGLQLVALARIERTLERESLAGLTDLANTLGESFKRLDHANQTIAGVARHIAAVDATIRAEAPDA